VTDPGAELPPPPPELLDVLRRIEAHDDVSADVRAELRGLRESLAAGRVPPPPSGSVVGSWGFTSQAEGHAGLSGSVDLRNAGDEVRKFPQVIDWLHAFASTGSADARWVDVIVRLSDLLGS
jgi:hypothetical protein